MKIIHGPNDLSALKTDVEQTALLDFLTEKNIDRFIKLINIISKGISEDITDLLCDMYIPYTTNLNEYGICKYYNDDTNLYNNEEILQCIKALTIINYNYAGKFNSNGGEFNPLNYTANEKPLLKCHTLSFWNNRKGNVTIIENVIGRWDNIYRDHSIYFIITEDSHIYYVPEECLYKEFNKNIFERDKNPSNLRIMAVAGSPQIQILMYLFRRAYNTPHKLSSYERNKIYTIRNIIKTIAPIKHKFSLDNILPFLSTYRSINPNKIENFINVGDMVVKTKDEYNEITGIVEYIFADMGDLSLIYDKYHIEDDGVIVNYYPTYMLIKISHNAPNECSYVLEPINYDDNFNIIERREIMNNTFDNISKTIGTDPQKNIETIYTIQSPKDNIENSLMGFYNMLKKFKEYSEILNDFNLYIVITKQYNGLKIENQCYKIKEFKNDVLKVLDNDPSSYFNIPYSKFLQQIVDGNLLRVQIMKEDILLIDKK